MSDTMNDDVNKLPGHDMALKEPKTSIWDRYDAEIDGVPRKIHEDINEPRISGLDEEFISRAEVERYAQEFEKLFPRPDSLHALKRWPPENDMRFLAFIEKTEDPATHARRREIYNELQQYDSLATAHRARSMNDWMEESGIKHTKKYNEKSPEKDIWMLWLLNPSGMDEKLASNVARIGRNSAETMEGSIFHVKPDGRLKIRLSSPRDAPIVARMIVKEAMARGWDTINLKTPNVALRQAVISEAREVGLTVKENRPMGTKLHHPNPILRTKSNNIIPLTGAPPMQPNASPIKDDDGEALRKQNEKLNNLNGQSPEGPEQGQAGNADDKPVRPTINKEEVCPQLTALKVLGVISDPNNPNFMKPLPAEPEAKQQPAPAVAGNSGQYFPPNQGPTAVFTYTDGQRGTGAPGNHQVVPSGNPEAVPYGHNMVPRTISGEVPNPNQNGSRYLGTVFTMPDLPDMPESTPPFQPRPFPGPQNDGAIFNSHRQSGQPQDGQPEPRQWFGRINPNDTTAPQGPAEEEVDLATPSRPSGP